jgi:K+-transporting ATPase A subunit
MKKLAERFLLMLCLLFAANPLLAQQPEMADTLRSEGKIYVVVLIILIILIGMIAYLFLLDKKIDKMEHMLNDKRQTKS